MADLDLSIDPTSLPYRLVDSAGEQRFGTTDSALMIDFIDQHPDVVVGAQLFVTGHAWEPQAWRKAMEKSHPTAPMAAPKGTARVALASPPSVNGHHAPAAPAPEIVAPTVDPVLEAKKKARSERKAASEADLSARIDAMEKSITEMGETIGQIYALMVQMGLLPG